jgi:hypothetical protein
LRREVCRFQQALQGAAHRIIVIDDGNHSGVHVSVHGRHFTCVIKKDAIMLWYKALIPPGSGGSLFLEALLGTTKVNWEGLRSAEFRLLY